MPYFCRLAAKCAVQSADVSELLLTLYEEQGCMQLCYTLESLDDMGLEDYLSSEETLMLLTKIVTGKKG